MIAKRIKKLLEDSFWPESLSPDVSYQRIHDDHDGTFTGTLSVFIDRMGDVYLTVDRAFEALRFRTMGGGGHSLRVRNALVVLAEAIRLDNEERSQDEMIAYSRESSTRVEANDPPEIAAAKRLVAKLDIEVSRLKAESVALAEKARALLAESRAHEMVCSFARISLR